MFNFIINFLIYFKLITKPKHELKVGNIYGDGLDFSSTSVRQITSISPFVYGLVTKSKLSLMTSGLRGEDFEDFIAHDEFAYLGNIND